MQYIPAHEATIEQLHACWEKDQKRKQKRSKCRRQLTPEQKRQNNINTKNWQRQNPEKYKAKCKKYRETHKEQIRARLKALYQKRKSRQQLNTTTPTTPTPYTTPTNPTWKHFVHNQWETLNRRTINGDNPDWTKPKIARQLNEGICLSITYEELSKWCEERKDQIESMYYKAASNSVLYPSIDRIMTADCDHYTLRNIQIVERRYNSTTRSRERELV